MSNTTNAKNLVYENNWAYLADTVMGGVSRGNAEFIPGALRLRGEVSTKNNVKKHDWNSDVFVILIEQFKVYLLLSFTTHFPQIPDRFIRD